MMTFDDFVREHDLKIKPTSNIKIFEVLKKIGLYSTVGIYLRDGPFPSNIGIVSLHPSKGTHSVGYKNEIFLDSYGFVPPKNYLILS